MFWRGNMANIDKDVSATSTRARTTTLDEYGATVDAPTTAGTKSRSVREASDTVAHASATPRRTGTVKGKSTSVDLDPTLVSMAIADEERRKHASDDVVLEDTTRTTRVSPRVQARDKSNYEDFVQKYSSRSGRARNWAIGQGVVGVLASVFGIDLMVTTFPVVAPTLALGSALFPGLLAFGVGAIGIAFGVKNIVNAVRYHSLLKNLRRAYTRQDERGVKLSREMLDKSVLKVHKLCRKLGIAEPNMSILRGTVVDATITAKIKNGVSKVARIAKTKYRNFRLSAHTINMKLKDKIRADDYEYRADTARMFNQANAITAEENARMKSVKHEELDPALVGVAYATRAEEGIKKSKSKIEVAKARADREARTARAQAAIKDYYANENVVDGFTSRKIAKDRAEQDLKQMQYEKIHDEYKTGEREPRIVEKKRLAQTKKELSDIIGASADKPRTVEAKKQAKEKAMKAKAEAIAKAEYAKDMEKNENELRSLFRDPNQKSLDDYQTINKK